MTKERRLGRGLEALLGRPLDESQQAGPSDPPSSPQPQPPPDPVPEPMDASPSQQEDQPPALRTFPADGTDSAEGGMLLSVYEIDSNPFQPRRDFDEAEIQQLAESIKAHGLIQPLVVRRVENRYQLVAGERRLRAAIKAGWSDVPAQLKVADDREMAELAIVENLQRKDLNPLEKAASFQKYLERYGVTQEELAGRLSIDRSTVSNLIRLLELPQPVQDALRRGAISQGHARALLPLGDAERQQELCRRIQAEGLSVRATEAIVHDALRHANEAPEAESDVEVAMQSTPSPAKARNEHLAALEQQLRTALGTRVELRQTAKGRGRIIVHFGSHDEFNRIHGQICHGQQSHREAG